MKRQLDADGRWNPKSGPREPKGMRQKERLRKQHRGRKGQSATRFRSHLLSASLPKGTIHQYREQERSTETGRRRPERSASSHHSLRELPALRIHHASILSLLSCHSAPQILHSFHLPLQIIICFPSLLITPPGSSFQLVFDSFRSSSSH